MRPNVSPDMRPAKATRKVMIPMWTKNPVSQHLYSMAIHFSLLLPSFLLSVRAWPRFFKSYNYTNELRNENAKKGLSSLTLFSGQRQNEIWLLTLFGGQRQLCEKDLKLRFLEGTLWRFTALACSWRCWHSPDHAAIVGTRSVAFGGKKNIKYKLQKMDSVFPTVKEHQD